MKEAFLLILAFFDAPSPGFAAVQNAIFLIMGLALLVLGSHWLVRSLKSISFHLKLKPLFLSIVVLGFVSSAPEGFVTVSAVFKGAPDAALGNILGSNAINILLILSLAGLFGQFSGDRQIVRFDMPILIGGILALGLFSLNQRLGRWEGAFLLGLFLAYLFFLLKAGKNKGLAGAPQDKKLSLVKSCAFLALGFCGLFAGSSLAVDSSLRLAEAFSLTERFAGVFILSLSTSLPELALCLQSVFKKEGEMALGNIVGSNMFNTLFILGLAGALSPLSFSSGLYFDYFFMTFVTLILFAVLWLFKSAPKIIFGLFIASYFIYIAFVSGAFG